MRYTVVPESNHYTVVDLHEVKRLTNRLTKFEAQDLANKLNKKNDGRQ